MNVAERLEALAEWGAEWPREADAEWDSVIQQAYADNPWFTPENTRRAMRAIADQFLDAGKLRAWLDQYPWVNGPSNKTVALVMAGNIPLAGFHDWLCVFAAGHRALVKLSDKDKVLLPFLVKKLGNIAFESWAFTEFVQEHAHLRDFDAIIATGSNNSARYFEQYFAKYPHIIRRNRNSIAVLDGAETEADLLALGRDVFSYFGLGCRNVSKLYVPAGYDFEPLLESLHQYRDMVLHNKYKNNFDYQFTLFLMNNIPFRNNGCILLREDTALPARIATLHYEYYDGPEDLEARISGLLSGIQCGVGKVPLNSMTLLPFGTTQLPGLNDYADGVDVMAFMGGI
ncbi:MAG: acyl-CoA reductase [Saprospiraceae bacterium]|nr:acyl-CoA reductase [Saprospiraceae bacterium]